MPDRTYVTQSGDTWDLIAYRIYGNERCMSDLIEANIDLRNTVIFTADIKLRIPEISNPVPAVLPPWKRG